MGVGSVGSVDRRERRGSFKHGRFIGLVGAVAAVGLPLLWGGCCTRHLAYFHATPLRFCKGTRSIEVSWFSDARSVTVTATPPIPELGDSHQAPIKTMQIAPQATSIQLDFGPNDNRPVQRIARLGPEDSVLKKGGFVAACVGGAVVAPFDFDPAEYASDVIVTAIQNPLSIEIIVEHTGASWTLPAGARVALTSEPGALDDPSRHLPHTWTIRAPLPGGCAASMPRPNKLGVEMTLECLP